MFRRLVLLSVLAVFLSSFLFTQDPAPRYIEWLGYLGGVGDDIGYGVATDAAGHVYVAGSTSSLDFGVAAGWPDGIPIEGASDAFVAKLSPDGGELLALAALIGPGADAALVVRVAPDGGVIVGGNVEGGFPAAVHDCGREVAGPRDVFVARFSVDLDLEALQLIGGSGDEGLRDVHVAPDGTIAVVGYTSSVDFLDGWAGKALQDELAGGANDFFVVRLRLDASTPCSERILYQTYLGGAGNEADPEGAPFPGGVRAGTDGVVTVAGMTSSLAGFPRKPGGFQGQPLGGADDAFVVRLRGDASIAGSEQLLYTAILGSSHADRPQWLEVDEAGEILLGGQTYAGDFPLTGAGCAFSGWNDNFVTVLDPSQAPAEQVRSSCVVGGEQWDLSTDGLLRQGGSVVIGGSTGSAGMPTTPDRLGPFNGGEIPQAYLYEWRLDEGLPRPERIAFATPLTAASDCIDGLRCNRVIALAESPRGSVIACGAVSGSLLVVAGDSAQAEKSGSADVFVGSFDLRGPSATMTLDKTSGEAPLEVCGVAIVSTPAETKIEATTWTITGPDGSVEQQGLELCHSFEAEGNYRITFTVKNDRDRVATRSQLVRVQAPMVPRFVRGNIHGQGDIDISDAVSVLNYLFLGSEAPPCLNAADGDGSGSIVLTDAIYLLDFLFLGGPAPPSPYPDCGADLTTDELGCTTPPGGCN